MVKSDNLHVDLTPELIEKAQKKFDLIANEGCTKKGVIEIDTAIKPDWYDEERFKRAQALTLEHYGAWLNCAIFGLLMFFQLPVCLVVLLATGKSKDSVSVFNRFFNTFLFLDEWLQSDPFDPKSKSFKTLSMVKNLHANAAKIMNKKTSVFEFAKKVLKESNSEIKDEEVKLYIRNKDRVWISQFDNATVEFASIGLLVLEPGACGFQNATKKDIEDFMYVWKVISYKLGVDLKYSFLEEIDYDLNYALFKILLEQEYIPHMEKVCVPTGIRLMDGIYKVFSHIFSGSSFHFKNLIFFFNGFDVYMRYWYKILNVNCKKLNSSLYEHDSIKLSKAPSKNQLSDEEKEIMIKNGYNDKYIVSDYNQPFEVFKLSSFSDKILYKFFKFVVHFGTRFRMIRKFIKNIFRNSLINTRLNRQKAVDKASEMHNDSGLKFSECPFAGSIHTEPYPDIYQEELNSTTSINNKKL